MLPFVRRRREELKSLVLNLPWLSFSSETLEMDVDAWGDE